MDTTTQQQPPFDDEVPIERVDGTFSAPGPEREVPGLDREELAVLARQAAEELPGMEEMMAKWIDTSTFLDEDAIPQDEEEK
jgi:hypothetical protein